MTASFFDPAALRTRLREQPSPDVPFLVVLLALLSYGLIMLFSAGYAVALYRRGDAYTYIRPQLLFAALGAAAMYAASLVDYHVWHKLAWPVMGLSLILLVVVLFMPEYNGCKRWIVLPGLGTLQPSEIAKFAVVLVFSHIISLNHDRMHSFTGGVLPFGLILGVVTVLMLLGVLAVCALRWLRVGGRPDVKRLGPYLLCALLPIAWYMALLNHSAEHAFFTYRALCVTIFAAVSMAIPTGKAET